MKLISPLGMYDLTPEELSVEENDLVLQGKMGIWEGRAVFTPEDLRRMAKLMLRPRIIRYLLTLPFKRGN